MSEITCGQDLTKFNEGCTLTAKPDAKGKWVIGWGHDITPSPGLTWTQDKADAYFEVDYHNAQLDAKKDLGSVWDKLTEERQAVLTDMAFEIGGKGLSEFVTMLDAVRAGDWQKAAAALRDSLLFLQVPEREKRNMAILVTSEWPQLEEVA